MAKDTPKPKPEIFIVGFQKFPPREKLGQPLYAVVTGTVSNPVVEKTPEPLEFAAEMAKRAMLHLLDNLK